MENKISETNAETSRRLTTMSNNLEGMNQTNRNLEDRNERMQGYITSL